MRRYSKKLSSSIIDRIDLYVEIYRLNDREILDEERGDTFKDIRTAIRNLNLSTRTYYKILKVARTIADLEVCFATFFRFFPRLVGQSLLIREYK